MDVQNTDVERCERTFAAALLAPALTAPLQSAFGDAGAVAQQAFESALARALGAKL